MSENKETSVWDSINESGLNFVNFNEMNGYELTVKFMSDEVHEGVNNFDRTQWGFQVEEQGEEAVFSTASIKLMLQLKEHRPLTGKSFTITREGAGYETTYKVVKA